MVGSSAGDTVDTIFPKINDEIAKLFEHRNVQIHYGAIIIFTGTFVLFIQVLNIVLNQKISCAAPQVISLGSSTRNFSANGRMLYLVIFFTAGTALVTYDFFPYPALSS